MSDIHKINVSLLKSYKTDFNSEQSNFSNVTYNTFSSCYIRRCNDPYISKMSSNLDTLYSRIHKGYSNINTWWSDYLKNVEGLEQSLSNNGKGGYIDETSVRNYVISKLSNLADIALDLPTLTKKNITIKNTVKFSANQVTSTMSHFSDLSTSNMAISSIKTGQALISRKAASKQQKYANLFSSIKGAFQGSGFSSLTSGISNFFGKAKDDIIGNYKQQEELMNSYMGVLVNPNSTEEESLQAILSCFGDTELGTASKISLAEHFCNIRATSGMDKIAVFDYLIQTGTLSETEKLGIYEFLKNDKSITNDEMIQISSYFATSCGLSDENTWEILNYTLDELYQMRGMPVEYKISEFMSFAEAMGYTEDQKKDCVKFIVYNDNSAEALLYYFQIFDIPEEEQNKEIEKFYKANGITISYEDNSFQTFEGDIDEDLKNIMMLYASDRCDKESYQEYLRTKGLHDNGWGDLLRYYRDKNYEPSFLERAQATFVNGFMSFGEGILGIGEKFWDVITYAGSKVYQFSSSAILSMSNDYTFAEVWDAYDQTAGKETQKSIAKEHVHDFFNDNFYNTQYGQYITETGYASNVVRGFANGAAGVLGNLTLAMATGGSSVFIAGVSGFGSGLEDYYASGGTDEGKAFLAGSLSGGIDAFSYWTGQKINNFNPFKTTVKDGVKQTFKHTFKDTVKNAALHVGLDSVDAFASSFMQTGAKAVWATGAYDENGTWHEFTDEDNYKTRFWSIFDEQGGWSAVGQNVLLGAGFSAFSEMSGIAKHFRKEEVVDVIYFDDVRNLLDEYDNLKKIQDSAEYKQYLDEVNKGHAHVFHRGFATLKYKMSSIEKQMADLKAKGIDFDEIGKNVEVSGKNISDNAITSDENLNKIQNSTIENINNTKNLSQSNNPIISSNEISANTIQNGKYIENLKLFGISATLEYDDVVIDSFKKVMNSGNVDSNVKQIFEHMDKLKQINPKLGILPINSGSGFDGAFLFMDKGTLRLGADASSLVLFHEFGHLLFHIIDGEGESFRVSLSDDIADVMKKTKNNVNQEALYDALRYSQQGYEEAVRKTIDWYDAIRSNEAERISTLVDDCFKNKDYTGINSLISSAKRHKLSQVSEILKEKGLSFDDFDDIMNDSELLKNVLIKQNAIDSQSNYLEKLMNTEYASQRSVSGMVNSLTQSSDDIVLPSGEILHYSYTHPNSYWTKLGVEDATRRSYDELFADFFSCKARNDIATLEIFRNVAGDDLYNLLDNQVERYANYLKNFGTADSKISSIQKQMSDLEAKGIDFDEIGKNTEISSKNISDNTITSDENLNKIQNSTIENINNTKNLSQSNNPIISSNEISANTIQNGKYIENLKLFGISGAEKYDNVFVDSFKKVMDSGSVDSNVKEIFEHMDKLKQINPLLEIGSWDSGSAFFGPNNCLGMNFKTLSLGADVSSVTLFHEFGHLLFHTIDGKGSSFKITLSDGMANTLKNARDNVQQDALVDALRYSKQGYDKAVSKTVSWYDTVRSSEADKISTLVDDCFKNKDYTAIDSLISSAKKDKLSQVSEILQENGLSFDDFDGIMNDSELLKKVLITQNGIDLQSNYMENLMSTEYASQRKVSSMLNSLTQSTDDIVLPNGEILHYSYGHPNSYWAKLGVEDDTRASYDELFADFFSCKARNDIATLEIFRNVAGDDLYNLLDNQVERYANYLKNFDATNPKVSSIQKQITELGENGKSNIYSASRNTSNAFTKLKSIIELNNGGFVDLDAINSVTTSIKSKAASLMDNLKKVKEADSISLKKLKKAKKYDDIYQIYGKEAYLKNTPSRYLKKDMNNLVKDNRFYELYEKYGEANYKKYIKQMQKVDVQYELGLKPGFLNYATLDNIGQKMKLVATKSAFAVSTVGTCMPLLLTGMFVVEGTSTSREASEKYADEFAEYNAEIEKYAEYINGLGLNDLEVIIKVMYDMHSNISYRDGSSMYDTYGSQRLHLYYNGYGVCRNMADDFSARLNAINPDYDACNLAVFIYGAELNDIERKIDAVNETVIEEDSTNSSTEANTNFFKDYLQDISGNHMVSCIYLKSEDVYLIVDPTNPSIGVIKDGEIYMLSDLQPDGIEVKPYGNLISGIDQYSDYRERAKKSGSQDVDIEALKKEYGIAAQNEALESIKQNTTTDHYNTKVD